MNPTEFAEHEELERQRAEDTVRWSGARPAPDPAADAWAAAIAHRAWGVGHAAELHAAELRRGGDGNHARATLLTALGSLQRLLSYGP